MRHPTYLAVGGDLNRIVIIIVETVHHFFDSNQLFGLPTEIFQTWHQNWPQIKHQSLGGGRRRE